VIAIGERGVKLTVTKTNLRLYYMLCWLLEIHIFANAPF